MPDWIKKNKALVFIILLFVLYQLFKNIFGVNLLSLNSGGSRSGYTSSSDMVDLAPSMGTFGSSSGISGIALPSFPSKEYTPQNTQNRLVIQESNLSLLVKDVVDTRNKILNYATQKGGYMINANTSNPEDAPTSTISIRIPANQLQSALDYFHGLSVKVVSENLLGTDVTDQYVDIDTRIAQIEKTMNRLEAILADAKQINDITNLTQQILNYQNQIDSLKGQKMSLEKNAELAKLTIYLSTDEIALPYSPSETFRPKVIFKLAVRALVGTLRGLATNLIWILVYSVVWVPLLVIYLIGRKWWLKRNAKI